MNRSPSELRRYPPSPREPGNVNVSICGLDWDQKTDERTLSDKTASAIDTGGMELHELEVLQRKASTGDHGVTVT